MSRREADGRSRLPFSVVATCGVMDMTGWRRFDDGWKIGNLMQPSNLMGGSGNVVPSSVMR